MAESKEVYNPEKKQREPQTKMHFRKRYITWWRKERGENKMFYLLSLRGVR